MGDPIARMPFSLFRTDLYFPSDEEELPSESSQEGEEGTFFRISAGDSLAKKNSNADAISLRIVLRKDSDNVVMLLRKS